MGVADVARPPSSGRFGAEPWVEPSQGIRPVPLLRLGRAPIVCLLVVAEESKIRDAADAAKGILEATPVYQDALQPAAKQVGKALETVGK